MNLVHQSCTGNASNSLFSGVLGETKRKNKDKDKLWDDADSSLYLFLALLFEHYFEQQPQGVLLFLEKFPPHNFFCY